MAISPAAARVHAHVERMRECAARGDGRHAYAVGAISVPANPALGYSDAEIVTEVRAVLRAVELTDRW